MDDQNAAARLAGLLDSAMDAIVTVDDRQRIAMYNRAAERIFGWAAAEVIGQPLEMLLPERFRGAHAGHVRQFGATGVTSRRMSGSTVVYAVRRNGDEFPVDASISQVTTPEGKLYTVILRDITERVRAESEQARLAARLAGLLDSAMDGIITVDADQRIVMYNRAAERIFGWPQLQVMGQRLDMLMPARFRHLHGAHLKRFGETGVTSRRMGADLVIHGLRRNGEEFPIEASISQLAAPEGMLYTVILRDVTERMRSQEDIAAFAKQASAIREQEKGRVARELHDELAQSLTAIKMDVAALRDSLAADPVNAAKVAAMLPLIDGAVTATRRIAADLRPLVLDDLGLVPAIEWLADNFLQRHAIPCALNVPDGFELGEPHATAVFRIVQESLVNVAKHAKARHVSVIISIEDGELRVAVRDDGNGFDPAAPRKQASLGLAGLRERAQLVNGRHSLAALPVARPPRAARNFPRRAGTARAQQFRIRRWPAGRRPGILAPFHRKAPMQAVTMHYQPRASVPQQRPAANNCTTCRSRERCIAAGLSNDDVARFDALGFARRRLQEEEPLFAAGQPFHAVYAVRSGTFKTALVLADGREQVMGFAMAGDLLGLDGLASGAQASAAVALEDSEVCVIPFADLVRLSQSQPSTHRLLARLLGDAIVRDQQAMLRLGSMTADERVAAFLLDVSRRMQSRGFSAAEFHLRMSRADIGSYLGLTLETVSRTLSGFQRERMIDVKKKHVVIHDLAALHARGTPGIH